MQLRAILASVVLATTGAWAMPASAVADQNRIDWDAPPNGFITSLYWGVLGRAPEPGNLGGWPAMITAAPGSRLHVFNLFINSAEHRGYSHSRGPANYAVFYRAEGNRWAYTVSTRPNGWFSKTGYMTYREAAARRDYYQTFEARR